ncbi:MAG TPA: hypothetical protein DIC42_01830 [Holosporales bacterium]|nr:hypothetical protein [Holosporales bacterium]
MNMKKFLLLTVATTLTAFSAASEVPEASFTPVVLSLVAAPDTMTDNVTVDGVPFTVTRTVDNIILQYTFTNPNQTMVFGYIAQIGGAEVNQVFLRARMFSSISVTSSSTSTHTSSSSSSGKFRFSGF